MNLFIIVAVPPLPSMAKTKGDPSRGMRAFLACVMCHSSEPGVHKAGPSLTDMWGRKAGTLNSIGKRIFAIAVERARYAVVRSSLAPVCGAAPPPSFAIASPTFRAFSSKVAHKDPNT